jgi:hypothetical protein
MKYKEWKSIQEIRRAYPKAIGVLTSSEWKIVASWIAQHNLNFRAVKILDSFENLENIVRHDLRKLSCKSYGWTVEKCLLITGCIPVDFQADNGYGLFGSFDDVEINQRIVILSQCGDIIIYQPDKEAITLAEFELSLL